jgi:hypothetical protein
MPAAVVPSAIASAAVSGAAVSSNNPAAVVLNQLIPATGQNVTAATNSLVPLVTATKPTDSPTNQLPSTGPKDSVGAAAIGGGNAPSISGGTPSALMGELMNNGGKSDKSAELSGQHLPGSIAVVMHGTDLSSEISPAAAGLATDTSISKAAPTSEIWTSTHGIESNPPVDLERTHDLVATHAMRLENSGNTSLTVVIKPGGGTQMSLELRQQSNGIAAQASLQQGDYKHLSQNWPELQQRLEQRGIRLAPLTDNGSSAFASSGGGQGGGLWGQPNPQPAESDRPIGFGGTLTATATASAPGAPAKTAAGWETWA